jgi:hypothetical protein
VAPVLLLSTEHFLACFAFAARARAHANTHTHTLSLSFFLSLTLLHSSANRLPNFFSFFLFRIYAIVFGSQ